MLSYQHEYHAGNHADILKHTCLSLILQSLCKKDKPFTVIDTHSSAGVFSLEDERILKTGEAKEGIERLITFCNERGESIPQGIKDYLSLEEKYLSRNLYAGSPEITMNFARADDQLHFIEKHPDALEKLRALCSEKDGKHITVHGEDSYICLKSLVPPLVKRGLILCDPSYEDKSDWNQVTEALKNARKKWNTAIIALWYPLLKHRKNETAQMVTALEDYAKLGTNPSDFIRCEVTIKNPDTIDEDSKTQLYGSGMIVINPPYMLQENLEECRIFLEDFFAGTSA